MAHTVRQTRQWAHDRRPLSPGLRGTNKQTRDGGGLPEGSIIPPGITHDLVLQFDLPARKAEREDRLLAMHVGDVNKTLCDICAEGGGKDARFLLAHGGADANHRNADGLRVLWWAARHGRLAVVEALLDAGAGELGQGLAGAAGGGHTAIVTLLLDRGADIHHWNDHALKAATFLGHLETVTHLLQRGATATNIMLAAAVRRGHHAVADLLRAHGAV